VTIQTCGKYYSDAKAASLAFSTSYHSHVQIAAFNMIDSIAPITIKANAVILSFCGSKT
jgi:hypothetical protein